MLSKMIYSFLFVFIQHETYVRTKFYAVLLENGVCSNDTPDRKQEVIEMTHDFLSRFPL